MSNLIISGDCLFPINHQFMYFNLRNYFYYFFLIFQLFYFLMKIIKELMFLLFQIILSLRRNYYLIYLLISLILDLLFQAFLKNYLYLMFDQVDLKIILYLGFKIITYFLIHSLVIFKSLLFIISIYFDSVFLIKIYKRSRNY